jgi:hypothetical protein
MFKKLWNYLTGKDEVAEVPTPEQPVKEAVQPENKPEEPDPVVDLKKPLPSARWPEWTPIPGREPPTNRTNPSQYENREMKRDEINEIKAIQSVFKLDLGTDLEKFYRVVTGESKATTPLPGEPASITAPLQSIAPLREEEEGTSHIAPAKKISDIDPRPLQTDIGPEIKKDDGTTEVETSIPDTEPKYRSQEWLIKKLEESFTLSQRCGYGNFERAGVGPQQSSFDIPPEWSIDLPADFFDGVECEICEVQSATPVIFRGEVMRIRRCAERLKEFASKKQFYPGVPISWVKQPEHKSEEFSPEYAAKINQIISLADELLQFASKEGIASIPWWEGPSSFRAKRGEATVPVEFTSGAAGSVVRT